MHVTLNVDDVPKTAEVSGFNLWNLMQFLCNTVFYLKKNT